MILGKTYLVTGAAGFIGSHVSQRLLDRGDTVIGLDNLNDYYDVQLKKDRLKYVVGEHENFHFLKADLEDRQAINRLFSDHSIDQVIHLAAQAGVRYSIENPHSYIDSNIVGFMNILEACRHHSVQHLVYASSSSVYGSNQKLPFSIHDDVDHPISLYAATKKSNELMAHTYSHLFGLPTTGLRFFTVYGPWGRPDMSMFLFTSAIFEGRPVQVNNHGKMKRDFTYIDDIVEGVLRTSDNTAQPHPDWDAMNPDPGTSAAPYRVYNIGNNNPVDLLHYLSVVEKNVGKEAIKNMQPMQAGDVPETYADIDDLTRDVGFTPNTPIEDGVKKFVDWYREYYKLN